MEIMDRRYFVYIILDNSLIYLKMVVDIIPYIGIVYINPLKIHSIKYV